MIKIMAYTLRDQMRHKSFFILLIMMLLVVGFHRKEI